MTDDQPPAPASPSKQNHDQTNAIPHGPDNYDCYVVELLRKVAETGDVNKEWPDLQRALRTRLERIIEAYQERAQKIEQQRTNQEQQPKEQNQNQQQPTELSTSDQHQQQIEQELQSQQPIKEQTEPEQQAQDFEQQEQKPETHHESQNDEEEIQLDEESCPRSTPEQFRPKPTPYTESFDFETSRDELFDLIESFSDPPFTIQRICELLYSPFKYYDRTSTFFRGLEKNLRVVSSSLDDNNKPPLPENNNPRIDVNNDGIQE